MDNLLKNIGILICLITSIIVFFVIIAIIKYCCSSFICYLKNRRKVWQIVYRKREGSIKTGFLKNKPDDDYVVSDGDFIPVSNRVEYAYCKAKNSHLAVIKFIKSFYHPNLSDINYMSTGCSDIIICKVDQVEFKE